MHEIDENQLRLDCEKADSFLKTISFNNNFQLKPEGVPCEWSEEMVKEYENCIEDYMYFIRKYMKIVSLDKGIIPFEPYDYQVKMIQNFHDNRFTINLCPRQCGKTTIATAFILDYVLFNENKTIVILANKQATAVEILDRVKLAYENLPKWMQQGCRTWNKTEIVLENGSKIGAYSSSSSAIRGMSVNCVSGDTYITILDNENGKIEQITINELRNRLKDEMFDDYVLNHRYEVLTENGFKDFDGLKISTSHKIVNLIFNDGNEITCTQNHLIKLKDETFKKAIDISFDDVLSNGTKLECRIFLNKEEEVFDLVNVEDGNEYFTNGLISHNCVFIDECAFIPNNIWDEFYMSVYPVIESGKETKIMMVSTPKGLNHFYKMWKDAERGKNLYKPFKITWRDVPGRDEAWRERTIQNTNERQFLQEHEVNFLGSSNTLFDMNKIENIDPIDPIIDDIDNYTKIYKEPEEGHVYLSVVDVSEGKDQDSSVIMVFDITKEPYEQVAVFTSNKISLMLFPFYINRLGTKYNDSYLLVENNSIGTSVTNDLFNDFSYENILYTHKDVNNKIVIDQGENDGSEMGIRMTASVKKIGCNNIKEIFESDKLIINDLDTVNQMSTFIRKNTSYAADESASAHDDLVMCLVHFGYAMKQMFFKEMLRNDITKSIANMKIQNDKMFHGFIDNGSVVTVLTDNNNDPFANWENVTNKSKSSVYKEFFNKQHLIK